MSEAGDSDETDDVAKRAQELYVDGKTEEARSLLIKATREGGTGVAGLSLLGRIEAELGNWTESKEALLAAIRIDPCAFETYFQLGLADLELGNNLDSEGWFTTYITTTGGDGAAWYHRAIVFTRLRRFDRAIADAEIVIARWPEDARGYLLFADAVSKSETSDQELVQRAINALDQARVYFDGPDEALSSLRQALSEQLRTPP